MTTQGDLTPEELAALLKTLPATGNAGTQMHRLALEVERRRAEEHANKSAQKIPQGKPMEPWSGAYD